MGTITRSFANLITASGPSAVANGSITAADLLSGVSVNTPAFFAYMNESTDQSISDATFTKAQIGVELFDSNNCYDNVTNYRFTPNVAGKYFVTYGLILNPFAADDVNVALLGIYKNGTLHIQPGNDFRNNPVSSNSIMGSQIIDFNGTTDYIELFGYLDEVTGGGAKLNSYKLGCYYGAYKLIGV